MIEVIIKVSIFLVSTSALVIAAIFIARFYLRRWTEEKPEYKDVVFLIRVTKESAKMEEEKEKAGGGSKVEVLREKIAISQTLYTNLSGLKEGGWFKRFFYGPQNYVSAEIVVKNGLIHFYLVVPRKYKDFVEQQVHAQYPDAEITQEADYNIFSEYGEIAAVGLKMRRNSILPLKTYRELEADPLNAITNALSKIDVKDGAAIQILARPKHASWSRRGVRVASTMQQGKKLNDALGAGINPLQWLKWSLHGVLTVPQYALSSAKSPQTSSGGDFKKTDYRLSPMEEEIVKGIENKASQFAYEANIRIVVTSPLPGKVEPILNNIVNAFAQYDNGERGNGFRARKFGYKRTVSRFIFRQFHRRESFVLSTEEFSSLWHLPHADLETPNIVWLIAKRAAPPVYLPSEGIVLGKAKYRGKEFTIRIKREDRRRHMYIIGKSGGGKSTLIASMAIQDVRDGEGVCVLDPHGDLVETVLEHIPKNRVDDVIYFNPSDTDRPMGLNMLEFKNEEQMDFAVQEMIAIFYKLFPPEMIGPMFEHNMRNVMLTLMADKEYPGTIADIPRMFTDKEYQQYKLRKLKDPIVRAFWEKEMAQTSDFHKSEMLGYLISKVGRFVENEMMRNIIGQPKSAFDVREVMDKKKILLVNLAKGRTGEVNSALLGLIIVSKLQMAAMGRAELPERERHDFFLYIDEFQNFITDSIATILSEARKYRLDLILAHQYLGQLKDEKGQQKVLDAVFGNVGTMIVFRVGVEDAEMIAKELAPIFNEYDVVNIEKYKAYIKLLIDNTAAPAFDMGTLPPEVGSIELASAIKELSRLKYGRPRAEVEGEILDRTKLGSSSSRADFGAIEASL